MKKIILLLVLLFGASFGSQNNNGLGLWLSNYGWGIDWKRLNGETSVLDVYLSGFRFSSSGQSSFGLDVGYYYLVNAIKADASMGKFPLHWGPNIGAGYWGGGDSPYRHNNLVIAPNIALGISWFPPTPFKWDISLELFPGLRIERASVEKLDGSWDSNFEFGLGIDVRFLVHFYLF